MIIESTTGVTQLKAFPGKTFDRKFHRNRVDEHCKHWFNFLKSRLCGKARSSELLQYFFTRNFMQFL